MCVCVCVCDDNSDGNDDDINNNSNTGTMTDAFSEELSIHVCLFSYFVTNYCTIMLTSGITILYNLSSRITLALLD